MTEIFNFKKKPVNYSIKRIILNCHIENKKSDMWSSRALALLNNVQKFLNDYPNEGREDINIFFSLNKMIDLYKKTKHPELKSYLMSVPGMFIMNADIDFDKIEELSQQQINLTYQNHGYLLMNILNFKNLKNHKLFHVNGYELFFYINKMNSYCIYYLGISMQFDDISVLYKMIEQIKNEKITTVENLKLAQILNY